MATTQKQYPEVISEYGNDWERGTDTCATPAAEKSGGVVEKAKDAAGYIGEKAEQATEAVGAGMESLGGAVRTHTPDHGFLHTAGDAVADKLEGAGHYLEDQGLKGLACDVTNMIRRNPIPALLIGVGVGFLLARIARR